MVEEELWIKYEREHLGNQNLLVIGMGNIGQRVDHKMSNFMNVDSYDVLHQSKIELNKLIQNSDCISIHFNALSP